MRVPTCKTKHCELCKCTDSLLKIKFRKPVPSRKQAGAIFGKQSRPVEWRTQPGKAQTQTIFFCSLCTRTVRTPSTRLHTFWFIDISSVRLFRLITLHGVRRSTGNDCFPKLAPACFREGTGFLNFIFNKPSVHLQRSQCFVLHVGTLNFGYIWLEWKRSNLVDMCYDHIVSFCAGIVL